MIINNMDSFFIKVVRMLISIVLTFVICWGPLLIFNVLQAFGVIGDTYGYLLGIEKHLKSIFSLLAYFNRFVFIQNSFFFFKFFSKRFVTHFSKKNLFYSKWRVQSDSIIGTRVFNTFTKVLFYARGRGVLSRYCSRIMLQANFPTIEKTCFIWSALLSYKLFQYIFWNAMFLGGTSESSSWMICPFNALLGIFAWSTFLE